QSVADMRHLFSRNGATVGEAFATVEVLLSLVQVGAALRNDGFELVAIGEHGVDLADGSGQLCLRLTQGDSCIAVVEAHELLAGLHQIGLVRADRYDSSADLRHHSDQVAGNVCVVRIFKVTAVKKPVPGCDDRDDDEAGGCIYEPPPSTP